jgi:hypothetical protein
MTSSRSDTQAARPAGASDSDRALLLALEAWADRSRPGGSSGPHPGGEHDFILRFWDWLDPAWVERLCARSTHELTSDEVSSSTAALDRLRTLHAESARVDLGRAHPSWWVRALKDESPAVQRAVTAAVAEPAKSALQNGLLLDSDDLKTERPPSPEVLGWVRALWAERLVGAEPERPDDSPALIVLARLSPRTGYRVCEMAGLAKLALAGQDSGKNPGALERRNWLVTHLPAGDAELLSLARQDIQSGLASGVPRHHRWARIGLATVARLLAGCEPVRLRWALQHWPYPLAKVIRSLLAPSPGRPLAPPRLDLVFLKTAWDRLSVEGKIAMPWPNSPGEAAPST